MGEKIRSRAMKKRHKEKNRVKEIVSVFLKHGLKEGINNPGQIRQALEELGPSFIKIGQMLSVRPDMLPEEYIREFQKLQYNARPEKFEDVKEIIEMELGRPINEVFQFFEKKPLACASLAVVHFAILKDGSEVAVKVQRPMARRTMLKDIALLKRVTNFMKYAPQTDILNLEEITDELKLAVIKELDFINEANNLKQFREFNAGVKYISCPEVFEEYTTQDILVMEYINGNNISDTDELISAGYDLTDIATKLVDNYLKQIFEDGFFHADPHPGNIIISGNRINYVDFGMVGTLNKNVQDKFNSFIYGVATNNLDYMTQAVLKIGIKKGPVDTNRLHSDIEEVYNNYIETSLHNLDLPQLMEQVLQVCRKNNLAMPREVVLLFKGLVTLEGIMAELAPDLNIMDIALPYAKKYIFEKRNVKNEIAQQLETIYKLSKAGLKLPPKLLELINSLLAGKVKVQMEHTNIENAVNSLSRMVNRIVFGLVLSSLVIGSSIVINANVGPKLYEMSIFGLAGYLSAAVMGIWLLVSILYSGKM